MSWLLKQKIHVKTCFFLNFLLYENMIWNFLISFERFDCMHENKIFFCLDFFTYWKKPDILIPDLENSPQLRSREGVQQFFKWYLKLFFWCFLKMHLTWKASNWFFLVFLNNFNILILKINKKIILIYIFK
jgi:hypothetical protein